MMRAQQNGTRGKGSISDRRHYRAAWYVLPCTIMIYIGSFCIFRYWNTVPNRIGVGRNIPRKLVLCNSDNPLHGFLYLIYRPLILIDKRASSVIYIETDQEGYNRHRRLEEIDRPERSQPIA
jgi:hypothetical protein